jgi:hypothetical protein
MPVFALDIKPICSRCSTVGPRTEVTFSFMSPSVLVRDDEITSLPEGWVYTEMSFGAFYCPDCAEHCPDGKGPREVYADENVEGP